MATRVTAPTLAGLKVVEFAQVIAGPMAGTLLADLGADVIHVESPAGDPARSMGPAKNGVPLWWKVLGRNKRSVTLNLHEADGVRLAHRLVEWADVAIVTFRHSTVEAFGLDYETLKQINPKIVLLQLSGYGAASSRRDEPGLGKVGEARSGVVHLTGALDGPPIHTGFSHGDAVAGLMGAFAITAAIRNQKDPDFQGEWIDLALFEPLFRLVDWQIIVRDQLGVAQQRTGNRLPVAPAAVINTYCSADGVWITVTSANARTVLAVVDLLNLDRDQYATNASQVEHRDELDAALAEWVGNHDADTALGKLQEMGVVASRIFDAGDILEDDTYRELGDIVTLRDPQLGNVRMQGVIPRLAVRPGNLWRTGAELGEDNELVWREWLGLSAEEFGQFRSRGVI